MSERRDEVLEYLSSHHVMTLATYSSRGPWAAAVFYANDGFVLTFLSSPRTRHAQDLEENPKCASAIHEDYSNWVDIQGVQAEGQARMLSGSSRIEAISRYARKFPVVRPDRAPALIRAALERVTWYEFVPDRMFFVDNSKGFGHREEIPPS